MILRVISVLFVAALTVQMQAQSISIIRTQDILSPPPNDLEIPDDLVTRYCESKDSCNPATLFEKNYDISKLNPKNNKRWQYAKYSVSDIEKYDYPAPGSRLEFIHHEADNQYTYMARVKAPNGKYFRFTLSRYTHTTLMRVGLMRKLGYFVPTPKLYQGETAGRTITLQFKSKDQMDSFLIKAQGDSTNDFESRGWIINQDDARFRLTFSHALLEPADERYSDFHWGFVPNPDNKTHAPIVTQFSKFRDFRALIIPYVLVDVPESINRFSPKSCSIRSNDIVLTHPSARTFKAATYEDGRWLMRMLSHFEEKDWREIVQHAQFPGKPFDMDKLVFAKLMHRVDIMFKCFNMSPKHDLPLPEMRFDSSDGTTIVKGKVKPEFIPGYPQRFSHGDRQSPFVDGDIERFVSIETLSTGVKYLLDTLNEELVAKSAEDHAEEFSQKLLDDAIQQFRENPFKPYERKVQSWGGWLGNAQLSASRHITTGAYFDSHAPIQLVDSANVGVSLGYFRALDGIENLLPIAGGNVTYTRSYVHVKPLGSIEEGTKVPWTDLFIPGFIHGLAEMVSAENIDLAECIKKQEEEAAQAEGQIKGEDEEQMKCQQPLDALMSTLKNGEVLTVSDTIGLGGYVGITAPIDGLLGLTPLGFINNVRLSFDLSKQVTFRQTQIIRTESGLQVFSRTLDTHGPGVQFDLNYFLNVLRLRMERKYSDIKTAAYVIDYDPELNAWLDPENPVNKRTINHAEKLKAALKNVLAHNDVETFETFFKDRRFKISHELKTNEFQAKILFHRNIEFDEEHLLKIQWPANPNFPDVDPADSEAHIFSYRKGELVGRDFFSLIGDTIDGILEKSGFLSRPSAPNPANTPFGNARWRIISTDADISPKHEQYPSVAVMQHVWGGWHLSRKNFLSLLDEVKEKFEGVTNVNMTKVKKEVGAELTSQSAVIDKASFVNTERVDFYRVAANLSIGQGGMERIRDLLLQDQPREVAVYREFEPKGRGAGAFFGELSEVLGAIEDQRFDGAYLPSDKQLFDDIVGLLGSGDKGKGLKKYEASCHEDKMRFKSGKAADDGPGYTGQWYFGTYYDCLASWLLRLIKQKRRYPHEDKRLQAIWMSETLAILDDYIPLPPLLTYLGEQNYIFFIRINGFREGDEDGDLQFFSNTTGDPATAFETSNGLIQLLSKETGLLPSELYKTNGSFR